MKGVSYEELEHRYATSLNREAEKDIELEAKQEYCVWADERIGDLEHALKRAREDMEGWGQYADTYFQEKWDLAGDLAAIDAVLKEEK